MHGSVESDDDDPTGLKRDIRAAAQLLPNQGPLKTFIHHNTLHALQDRPFHDALREAYALMGGEPYLTEAEYRSELELGRIDERDVEAVLEYWTNRTPDENDRIAPGFPTHDEIRRSILWFGLKEETQDTLAFAQAELQISTKFPKGVDQTAETRIVERTLAHLKEALAANDLESLRQELTLADEPSAADRELRTMLGVPLDVRRIEAKLVLAPKQFASHVLFVACARRARGRATPPSPAKLASSHRARLVQAGGPDITIQTDPYFIRLLGGYFDRGLAYWPMPDREKGFLASVHTLLSHRGALPPSRFLLGTKSRLEGPDALSVLQRNLEELGVDRSERSEYLRSVLLELPGWAGMMRRIEETSEDGLHGSLAEYLAVRLALQIPAIIEASRRIGIRAQPSELRDAYAKVIQSKKLPRPDLGYSLFQILARHGVSGPEVAAADPVVDAGIEDIFRLLLETPEIVRRRYLHEAYENHYARELLKGIRARRALGTIDPAAPRFQLVFCIDDREESMRRHVEEVLGSAVETLGAPGFFGLAISYRGLDDAERSALCPVVMNPEVSIDEIPVGINASTILRRDGRKRTGGLLAHGFAHGSRGFARGLVSSLVFGPLASVPLILATLDPRRFRNAMDVVERKLLSRPATELTALNDGTSALGLTMEQAVEHLFRLFQNMGVTRFAPMVVIVGHGSSSINNPHLSAYQCGACGGRPGGPNARLFAWLANRADIRDRLAAKGLKIPDATWFVGVEHDTSADSFRWFDVEMIPTFSLPAFEELRSALERAAERQAHERCRRFEAAPLSISPADALLHVQSRAVHLAEPRPEYNHATNAACIVGRRSITRGLFLDRRSFLVSYDEARDPTGAVLARVLGAALPVCAGINLEYYFSRVDNERYGSGTKLPHNVTGLIGVMNGHSSDLRTGLWRQTVEIHEPVRLFVVVEASPAKLEQILAAPGEVRELVTNGWVRLLSMERDSGVMWRFADGKFAAYTPELASLPEFARSIDWYQHKRTPLGPALIRGAFLDEKHAS